MRVAATRSAAQLGARLAFVTLLTRFPRAAAASRHEASTSGPSQRAEGGAVAVPRAPLLEGAFVPGGRLGSLVGSTLHTMAKRWYVEDPWVYESIKERMESAEQAAAGREAARARAALEDAAEIASAPAALRHSLGKAAQPTSSASDSGSQEPGRSTSGIGTFTAAPSMVRHVKTRRPVFGSSTPRDMLFRPKASDAHPRGDKPPHKPRNLQSITKLPSGRGARSRLSLRPPVSDAATAPKSDAADAAAAGSQAGLPADEGDEEVVSGSFMPAWVTRRAEFESISNADTRTMERRVKDALRTVGSQRSASQIATLVEWLGQHSAHFRHLPATQQGLMAQSLVLMQLAPDQQLDMSDFDSQPLQTERERGGSPRHGRTPSDLAARGGGLSLPPQLAELGSAVHSRGGMVFFVLSGALLVLRGLLVTTLRVGDMVGTPAWVSLLQSVEQNKSARRTAQLAAIRKALLHAKMQGHVLSAVGAKLVALRGLTRDLQRAALVGGVLPGTLTAEEAAALAEKATLTGSAGVEAEEVWGEAVQLQPAVPLHKAALQASGSGRVSSSPRALQAKVTAAMQSGRLGSLAGHGTVKHDAEGTEAGVSDSVWGDVYKAAAANVRLPGGRRYATVQISRTFNVGNTSLPTVVVAPPPTEGSVASAAAAALFSKQLAMQAAERERAGTRSAAAIWSAKGRDSTALDREVLENMISSANGGSAALEHQGRVRGVGGDEYDIASTLGVSLVRLSMADYERCVIQEHQRRSRQIAQWLRQRVPTFSSWPRAKLLALARQFEVTEFEAGQVIFNQGEPADSLCMLSQGGVEVFATVPVRVLHAVPTHRPEDDVPVGVGMESASSLDTYEDLLYGASSPVQAAGRQDRKLRRLAANRQAGKRQGGSPVRAEIPDPDFERKRLAAAARSARASRHSLWCKHMSVRVRRVATGEWFGEEAAFAVRYAVADGQQSPTPSPAARQGGVLSGDDDAEWGMGGAADVQRKRATDTHIFPIGEGREPWRLDDNGRIIIQPHDTTRTFTAVATQRCTVLRLSQNNLHRLVYDAATLINTDSARAGKAQGGRGGDSKAAQARGRGSSTLELRGGVEAFQRASDAAKRMAAADSEAVEDLPDPLYLLFALQHAASLQPSADELAQEHVHNSIQGAERQVDTWSQLGSRYVRRLARGGVEPIGVTGATATSTPHEPGSQPTPVLPDGVGGFGSTNPRGTPSVTFRDVMETLHEAEHSETAVQQLLPVQQGSTRDSVELRALHLLPVSRHAHPASVYCSSVARVSGLAGAVDDAGSQATGGSSVALLTPSASLPAPPTAAPEGPIGSARAPPVQRLKAGVDARVVARAIATGSSKVGAASDTRSLTGKVTIDQTRDEGVHAMQAQHAAWLRAHPRAVVEESPYFTRGSMRPGSTVFDATTATRAARKRGERTAAASDLSASAQVRRMVVSGAGGRLDEDPVKTIVPKLLGASARGRLQHSASTAPGQGTVRSRARELAAVPPTQDNSVSARYYDAGGLRTQMAQLTDVGFARLFDDVATRLRASERKITARLYDDDVDRLQYTGYEREEAPIVPDVPGA